MTWYYAKNGQQNGPVPTEDMIDRIAMGDISPTDLAWSEGMADWLPVSQIPQLQVAPPVRPAEPSAAPVGAATASPYQPPAAAAPAALPSYAAPGQPPSQGLAIGALVCGILAIVSCCVWPIGIIFVIAAIILGHMSLSKIKADPARNGGKGMAKTGLITGYIGLLLFLVGVAMAAMFGRMTPEQMQEKIINFFPAEQQDEIRREMEKQQQLPPPAAE